MFFFQKTCKIDSQIGNEDSCRDSMRISKSNTTWIPCDVVKYIDEIGLQNQVED